jgi:hypothetical protein
MEEFKNKIIDRGYSIVEESEEGIAFVNEDTQFCAILLKFYSDEDYDRRGFKLHDVLKSKFSFAEKCTICIILDSDIDKEKLVRDEYFYCKILPERINILPIKSDKSVKIIFSPMDNASDVGDYTVNPFEPFDGLCSSNYIEFLSNAKDGNIVKYPKIVNNSYFRYLAYKLYNIEVIN